MIEPPRFRRSVATPGTEVRTGKKGAGAVTDGHPTRVGLIDQCPRDTAESEADYGRRANPGEEADYGRCANPEKEAGYSTKVEEIRSRGTPARRERAYMELTSEDGRAEETTKTTDDRSGGESDEAKKDLKMEFPTKVEPPSEDAVATSHEVRG
ncbi:hypothetical protein NDU88_008465 [Pleurodeles waltl]|uniref:Uncharacterized protein n=1 Tax=Pleurodeles waltl TaxID=8319 RepID=A0AAV7QUQ2_PLEWA|nr:hypothetical protein NDU88_008465 [Pleurodeles waltl]